MAKQTSPEYPEIVVGLADCSGNLMAVIDKVSKALAREGVGRNEVNDFVEECACAGGYSDLIKVCQRWVTCQ